MLLDWFLEYFFPCLSHTGEWIAGATCMYIASHLVNNYGTSAEVSYDLSSAWLCVCV